MSPAFQTHTASIVCTVFRSAGAAQETGTAEDVHTSNQGWSFQASQGQESSPSSSLQMTTWSPNGEVINGNESSLALVLVLVSCPSQISVLYYFFPWFWFLMLPVWKSSLAHHWCHSVSRTTFINPFASCLVRCLSYLCLWSCLYASCPLRLMEENLVALPESHLHITVLALFVSVLPANERALSKCVILYAFDICSYFHQQNPPKFINWRNLWWIVWLCCCISKFSYTSN